MQQCDYERIQEHLNELPTIDFEHSIFHDMVDAQKQLSPDELKSQRRATTISIATLIIAILTLLVTVYGVFFH